MKHLRLLAASWAVCAAAHAQVPPSPPAAPGAAMPAPADPSRGRLLYDTHCVACHNTQVHWRDARRVEDWDGLKAQVRAWQQRARLGWSDADVLEVSRYLNDVIYRVPQTGDLRSQAVPGQRG